MFIIDVSDPLSPEMISSLDTPGSVYHVTVFGYYAYISDCKGGVRVVDITDPNQPVEVGSLATPDWAYKTWISNGYAYVAAGEGGLLILDTIGYPVYLPMILHSN